MSRSFDRITVRGFKSIQSLEGLEMRSLNVLIGPNGAGKSNFASLAPAYRKRLHEPILIERIGLEPITAACPHFGEWIRRLHAIKSRPS